MLKDVSRGYDRSKDRVKTAPNGQPHFLLPRKAWRSQAIGEASEGSERKCRNCNGEGVKTRQRGRTIEWWQCRQCNGIGVEFLR
jgi:DnaJ-class molecular chaperone